MAPEALLQMVIKPKWYLVSSNVEVTEEDVSLFNQFNHYSTGKLVKKTQTIIPPKGTAALIHWRLTSNIINIIGEEDIHLSLDLLRVLQLNVRMGAVV